VKIVNSKTKKEPLLEPGFTPNVMLMDKITWNEILKWSKELEKKQLEFPFYK